MGDGGSVLTIDINQITLLAKKIGDVRPLSHFFASRLIHLQNLRAEFAVAHPGANFHSWPDIAHGPDQIAFGVSRDAVTAAERGVGSEHAQDPFDAPETLPCVFEQVSGRRDQSPMQIRETVAAHHEFPHGTARL